MNDGRSAADDCETNSGFGLAAILMASGMLAPLLGKGVLHPDESRQLIDHAITTLEQMPFDDEMVRGAGQALAGWRCQAADKSAGHGIGRQADSALQPPSTAASRIRQHRDRNAPGCGSAGCSGHLRPGRVFQRHRTLSSLPLQVDAWVSKLRS
jgi:hypothetical protein